MQQRLLEKHERRHFLWLGHPFVRKVAAILNGHTQDSVRFVGGCVRDSLLGITPLDIDMATSLLPQTVMEVLQENGIKIIPTGLDHGTVTAMEHRGISQSGHKKETSSKKVIEDAPRLAIEITSLRKDVTTDGRRATIAYTDDWAEDACRRDFTINALYLTPEGDVVDFVGGLSDIKESRVRFIGTAEQRIKEDYLRILRFFRFSARFSHEFDEDGLRAIQANLAGIKKLSRERIGAEFCKILELPNAYLALENMISVGCAEEIIPYQPDIDSFKKVKRTIPQADAILGLTLLYPECREGELQDLLRLSNAQAVRLDLVLKNWRKIKSIQSREAACIALYEMGKSCWRDCLMLAYGQDHIDAHKYEEFLKLANEWTIPVLPVSGRDILAHGVKAGPHISMILKEVETIWKQKNFPDEKIIREVLEQSIKMYKE